MRIPFILAGLLALGASAGPVPPAPSREVLLTIEVRAERGVPSGVGEVVLESREHRHRTEGSRSLPVRIPGSVSATLPPGSLWQARLSAEGLWAAPRDLAVRDESKKISLHAFTTAPVSGSLVAPRGTEVPDQISIRLAPPPSVALREKNRVLPAGAVACIPEEADRLRCALPEGVHDFQISAPGFATEYRWGVAVAGEPRTDLGAIHLRPGGSLIGSVVSPPGVSLWKSWVELEPVAQQADTAELYGRLESLIRSAAPDERGFFQFVGLPAGPYRLRVGGEGAVEQELTPIEIFEGRESRLADPLRLAPPLPVRVVLRPATTPRGEPWFLRLNPLAGTSTWRVTMQAADPNGVLEWPEGVPGLYELQVLDRFRNHWHSREIELADGKELLEVALPLVEVEGRVRLGERGVRSRLLFKQGLLGPEVPLYSDPDGQFSGMLPGGVWMVRALLRARGSWAEVGEVEIFPTEDGEPLKLDLGLSGTSISGLVVDQAGRPVADATITASRRETPARRARVQSDPRGHFLIEALRPGPYTVLARGRQTVDNQDGMAKQIVNVPESSQIEGIRLTLPRYRPITGRIVSPYGPLPGARVSLSLPDHPGGSSLMPEVTDVDGRFTVQAPGEVERVTVVVEPAGYAARLLTLSVGVDRILPEIAVDDFGGEVLIVGIQDEEPPIHWSLRSADSQVRLLSLARYHPADLDNDRLWRIARLAAGEYLLCYVEDCRKIFVPPGATTTVTAPG